MRVSRRPHRTPKRRASYVRYRPELGAVGCGRDGVGEVDDPIGSRPGRLPNGNTYAVAAGRLRRVKRGVGGVEKQVQVSTGDRQVADAHRDRDRDPVATVGTYPNV